MHFVQQISMLLAGGSLHYKGLGLQTEFGWKEQG